MIKVFTLIVSLLFSSHAIYSAPKSILISFWDKSNEVDTRIIDHSDFNIFLDKNRRMIGEYAIFEYSKISTADKQLLNNYIKRLESVNILSYNKKEQFAYWINLYNAFTIKTILDNYPVDSILQIPNKLIRLGPWNKKLIGVEGQKISLNNIEHGILRPIWKDPRIHFVVNCASIGCPNIPDTALTSANSEAILEKYTIEFLNTKKAVSIKNNKLILTSLFDWYGNDFGKGTDDYINYIKKYANPSIIQKLNSNYKKIEYEYDWNLNESKFVPR